jgi:hypothetical protein
MYALGQGMSPGRNLAVENRSEGCQVYATDAEIDRLVYELYDLTEEEIAIVRESTR